jgi:nucleotide-binding universal stress UspA family protein
MPLTLVHVVKPFTCQTDCGYGPVTRQIPDQPEVRKARARLKRLARKLSGVPRPAEIQVLSGTAPFEITQAAKALGTDLIIMACHGTREAPNHIGRIAEAVVRRAPCPVFVLREKELESRK